MARRIFRTGNSAFVSLAGKRCQSKGRSYSPRRSTRGSLWTIGIFVCSSLPKPLGPRSDTPYSGHPGRLCHVGEYAGLTAPLYRAVWPGRTHPAAAIRSFFPAPAYALTDEVHQTFVPGRESSVLDPLLDRAGVVGVPAACQVWLRAANRLEVTGEEG